MSALPDEVSTYGYGLALLAHAALAAYLLSTGRTVSTDKRAAWPFLGALLATAGWAAVNLLGTVWNDVAAVWLALGLDLGRYALWFVFLLARLDPARGAQRLSSVLGLRWWQPRSSSPLRSLCSSRRCERQTPNSTGH